MKKIITIASILALGLLGSVSTVQAQERMNVRQGVRSEREAAIELRDQLKETRNKIRDQRQELRGDVQAERAETREDMNAQRAETRAELQAAESNEERAEIRAEAQLQREAYKEENQQRRASYRSEAQGIISQRADLVMARYDAVLERVTSVLSRINEKIQELEEQGTDASAAASFSAEAEASLDAAGTHFRQAAVLYTSIDAEAMDREEIRRIFNESKELLKAAKEDIQAAWSLARQAVNRIKVSANADVEA